jgi:hypothetical protein
VAAVSNSQQQNPLGSDNPIQGVLNPADTIAMNQDLTSIHNPWLFGTLNDDGMHANIGEWRNGPDNAFNPWKDKGAPYQAVSVANTVGVGPSSVSSSESWNGHLVSYILHIIKIKIANS